MECGNVAEEEFVDRLQSLGVQTHGLSFGWMLNEYDSYGVLRWMFTHLNADNALTAREACRYTELEEKGLLLPEEELDETISDVLRKSPGLTLPGDAGGLRRAQRENNFLRERLGLLHKHEKTLEALMDQNELAREEVSRQIVEVKESGRGRGRDAAEECLRVAECVERREEELFAAVARNLDVYCGYQSGKELWKRFVWAGPLQAYTQSRRLFRSHFKLCASRRLQADGAGGGGGAGRNREAAKLTEKRLYDAILDYVESVVELSLTRAETELVSRYEEVHPSRVLIATTECLSSLELLKQDAALAQEELRVTALAAARAQTARALSARARAALEHRREVYGALCALHACALQCACLDALLYLALRRELQRSQDTVRFAADVREYLQAERANVAGRIEAMCTLHREHADCEQRLRDGGGARARALRLVCGAGGVAGEVGEAHRRAAELGEELRGEFQRKEQFLDEIVEAARPLARATYDGCTHRPSAHDGALTRLSRRLRDDTAALERKVTQALDRLTAMKSKPGDVRGKLWQWFLTEPERLLTEMEALRRRAAR